MDVDFYSRIGSVTETFTVTALLQGVFTVAGWIGHSDTVPGYGTVAVYLPDRGLALVILVNTDIRYRGADPAMTLAAAITRVISPDHVYDIGL